MSISTDEVGYLILRYLEESGFRHSSFTFGHESTTNPGLIHGSQIPPGALITLLEKGLLYVEAELDIPTAPNDDPNFCGKRFTVIDAAAQGKPIGFGYPDEDFCESSN